MSDSNDRGNKKREAAQGDYEIGFGRPPKSTRFKPGQSGNPRGRPKGAKNFETDLRDQLNERVVIREGDRSRKVTKQQALIASMVNRGIKGEPRLAALSVSTIARYQNLAGNMESADEELTDDELLILRDYVDEVIEQRTESTNKKRDKDALEEEDK